MENFVDPLNLNNLINLQLNSIMAYYYFFYAHLIVKTTEKINILFMITQTYN